MIWKIKRRQHRNTAKNLKSDSLNCENVWLAWKLFEKVMLLSLKLN